MSQYGDVCELNEEGRPSPGVKCGPGRTKQSFKDEVDINKIIARFEKTGMVDHVNQGKPFYGDVSAVRSYREALECVRIAEDLFMGYPAGIRERFDNDPAKLIEFLDDRKNLAEAIELGLVQKAPDSKSDPKASDKTVEPPTPQGGGDGSKKD